MEDRRTGKNGQGIEEQRAVGQGVGEPRTVARRAGEQGTETRRTGGTRTEAESVRRRQERLRRAKRKRRILIFELVGAVFLILFGILILKDFLMGWDSRRFLFAHGGGSSAWETDYDAAGGNDANSSRAPKVLSEREVEEELRKLAKTSKEYREIYEARERYPWKMLAALVNNPEMLDFVKDYPDSEGEAAGGFTKEELSVSIPLLMQWDKRWGYVSYGSSNVGMAGCAPTCLSMVIVALTGNEKATPDAIAEFAEREGYYREGSGTAWSLMTEGCRSFGINGREISLDEGVIKNHLAAGEPVICSVRPGDFTTEGHFILLVGVKEGKFIVYDPNSRGRSSRLWDYETLKGQIKNLWIFYE